MPDLLDRLKTALADRYAIQEKLGAERFTPLIARAIIDVVRYDN